MLRIPKTLGVDTFPDPVGHFGAPWRPFWILQLVRRCRRWASYPAAIRLVSINKYYWLRLPSNTTNHWPSLPLATLTVQPINHQQPRNTPTHAKTPTCPPLVFPHSHSIKWYTSWWGLGVEGGWGVLDEIKAILNSRRSCSWSWSFSWAWPNQNNIIAVIIKPTNKTFWMGITWGID